ncbi:hypothetical protein KHA94_00200 [Bacillus sp. FJAT-49705]|uniref:Uncharacterized protein n=1 Tax=Cytobacillus citreus TaxID=2833586 RepID=A0ABS5NLE9_9BACI|nr:hypothetical protein [Cytobacillus citreus]MBS4188640.1 hypothetical protein [Cytobacillus citreus]
MAELPKGKQRITIGCYYTLQPAKGMCINTSLVIRWYGLPFLMWKRAHEIKSFKWYEYPLLVWLIAKHTLKKWVT